MSNCFEDLKIYELVRKCYQCGIIILKSNFHKIKKSKDGLTPHCKFCRKNCRQNCYYDHYDLEINRPRKLRFENKDKIKKYNSENRDNMNEYFIKKRISFNFKLTSNLRSRTSLAFNSKNVRKI